ncbi:mitochondrial Homoaconitase [Entomophthora muscae]|uniref:Mitochondrial Homoaconitase n=1 Tax=Entomophthora muscae TaxID=34485 RepID=A0ACC2SMU9_9FUNG|nr:mitochondrial Homoaconitase [Entomophthora muscae]
MSRCIKLVAGDVRAFSKGNPTKLNRVVLRFYSESLGSRLHTDLGRRFLGRQSPARSLATVTKGFGLENTYEFPLEPPVAEKRPQNLIEKIVQRYLHQEESELGSKGDPPSVHSGDFVTIRPHHILTHDNTGAVMKKFKSIGVPKIKTPTQPVFALDHDVQNKSESNLLKYSSIEKFAKEQGVDFYPAGRGIGHQVMIEEGYAFPNTLTVASDSHSNMYGGVGCLGTPLVRTDAAAVWATGKTWWQVPQVVKVQLIGKLASGVTGKDVIVALCGQFNKGEVLNCAIEFSGEALRELSIDDRLAIANMSTEWGALAAVFPCDETTITWLEARAKRLGNKHPRVNSQTIQALKDEALVSDRGAFYRKKLTLDLGTVVPHASGPNAVTIATPVSELESQNIKIHKAYLVSCTNARLTDLAQAAAVVANRKIHPNVEFYVAAASSQVQEDAEAQGHWKSLLDAGARPLPPGCGPCVGLGVGLLKDGEVGISATNRNFKGRMGSRKAQAYLASPAVVAASAVNGRICLPEHLHFAANPPKFNIEECADNAAATRGVEFPVVSGFPALLEGEALYCGAADNLNTDGIYAGVHTYNDRLTKEEMATVVMENYDPKFRQLVRQGDILVGGFNFGTGSSREQAATALLAAGVKAVIAGSYSETYKRNAINNGLLVLECPHLVERLRSEDALSSAPTVRSGFHLQIDFRRNQLICRSPQSNKDIYILTSGVGKDAQTLYLRGGLENWVRAELGL